MTDDTATTSKIAADPEDGSVGAADVAGEPTRAGGNGPARADDELTRDDGNDLASHDRGAPAGAAIGELAVEDGGGLPSEDETDHELSAEIRDLIARILKAARSAQMYVPGNPLIEKFRAEAATRFAGIWERIPELALEVDESRLLWNGHAVYEEPIGPDNLAFHFFKDGIRGLVFTPGVEEEEIEDLLDLIRLGRAGKETEDVLAAMWHRDFRFIRVRYSRLSPEDEGIEVPTPDRNAGAGETLEDLSEVENALEAAAEAGEIPAHEQAELAAVYLSDADRAYLRRELEGEWQRPLKRDITLALLDQFEMRDEERRRQVVDVLRELLPRLLAEADFSNVALILNELQLLANKTGEQETQELVTSLLRDMSEAVAEKVSTAAEEGAPPEGSEMSSLLGALQAEAIPTLVRAIPAVSNLKLRRKLAESLDRLVATDPSKIIPLLGADDPVLAGEAARIVARLRIHEAASELVALAGRAEEGARRAAIEALAELGAREAAADLIPALADSSRDVRLAAARALAELRPPGAEDALEGWVTGSALAERDPPEQMAFFKAYAGVAGEGAVPTLDRLLNGRRWWGGRQSSTARASAARALGHIPGEAAGTALERAQEDRDAQVRSAVRIARRAHGAPAGQGAA